MIDRNKFFTEVRPLFLNGHLTQSQVDGMNVILDAWEASRFTDLRWLGYMFGTTFRETGEKMQPIHEYGSDSYFTRMYDIEGARPDKARQLGNTTPGDGIKYCGRGFVQLTGKSNYERMGSLIGEDLVGSPDLAMDPTVAVKIMIIGMTGPPHDTFSGVNLQRYFNDTTEDWVGARHIINGQDHATEIAGTAQAFYDALTVLPEPVPVPVPIPVPPVPVPPIPVPPESPEMKLLNEIRDILHRLYEAPVDSVSFALPRFYDKEGNPMPISVTLPNNQDVNVPMIFKAGASVVHAPVSGGAAHSDNEAVATASVAADDGSVNVVSVADGACTISYSNGAMSDTIALTVSDPVADSVAFNPDGLTFTAR